MSFGLSGLAVTWLTATQYGLVPAGVGERVMVVATMAWFVTVTLYVGDAKTLGSRLGGDLQDEIAAPSPVWLLTPTELTCSRLCCPAMGC
jgi:hypothetical protein